MAKFKVQVYQETYTDFIVDAECEDEACDKALMGEYEFIEDVTTKESEVMGSSEIDEEE